VRTIFEQEEPEERNNTTKKERDGPIRKGQREGINTYSKQEKERASRPGGEIRRRKKQAISTRTNIKEERCPRKMAKRRNGDQHVSGTEEKKGPKTKRART